MKQFMSLQHTKKNKNQPHPHLNPLPEGEETFCSLPFKGRGRVGMGLKGHFQVKRLFLTITLISVTSISAFAGMRHDHSSHQGTVPDLRTQRSGVVESGLSPASKHKMDTVEANVGGYEVSMDIMTHKDYQNMMKAMKMEPMKEEKGTTHHIAVAVRKNGSRIEDAAVSLKVTGPDGKEEVREMPYNKDMMFQYTGHFNMSKKGKYQMLITVGAGKEKHQGAVNYEVK